MSVDFNTLAQQFTEFYYNQFDTDRTQLGNLYREQSMLTFETTQLQGAKDIVEKLVSLPFQKDSNQINTPQVPSSRPLRARTARNLEQVPKIPQGRPARRHTEYLDAAVQGANDQLDQLREAIDGKHSLNKHTEGHEKTKEQVSGAGDVELPTSIPQELATDEYASDEPEDSKHSPLADRNDSVLNSIEKQVESSASDAENKTSAVGGPSLLKEQSSGVHGFEASKIKSGLLAQREAPIVEDGETKEYSPEPKRDQPNKTFCDTGDSVGDTASEKGSTEAMDITAAGGISKEMSTQSDDSGTEGPMTEVLKRDQGTQEASSKSSDSPQTTQTEDESVPLSNTSAEDLGSDKTSKEAPVEGTTVEQTTADMPKVPSRPAKRAPPKKPSSKIAAFQEMLKQQQLQDQSKQGGRALEDGNTLSSGGRNKIATSLNGIFGIPGMVPPGQALSVSSRKPEVNEATKSPENSPPIKQERTPDVPQRRAKGPRGRKLPAHLANVEKVDASANKCDVQVTRVWSLQFHNTKRGSGSETRSQESDLKDTEICVPLERIEAVRSEVHGIDNTSPAVPTGLSSSSAIVSASQGETKQLSAGEESLETSSPDLEIQGMPSMPSAERNSPAEVQ
ncbi:LADA_0E13542g1_1 [Lachancea dasiensis]|uniref:Nuclear transport factor 2 n=1 Tax=Lachancea dasiensis TaxID=1072105 RepID=A0A1G4JFI8_9SACH|nr:LADA_0E13542g1_1 [Lachancea dasiensis]